MVYKRVRGGTLGRVLPVKKTLLFSPPGNFSPCTCLLLCGAQLRRGWSVGKNLHGVSKETNF